MSAASQVFLAHIRRNLSDLGVFFFLSFFFFLFFSFPLVFWQPTRCNLTRPTATSGDGRKEGKKERRGKQGRSDGQAEKVGSPSTDSLRQLPYVSSDSPRRLAPLPQCACRKTRARLAYGRRPQGWQTHNGLIGVPKSSN
ncbi:hypothetical protein LY78DRAFT_118731 [Colletotrichum sublineola]|nr:hypothetical protein LY78DRAFT_118731 [Colletotrichum sublineola]